MDAEKKELLSKNYPLIYDKLLELGKGEDKEFHGGIFNTVDSIIENIELVSEIEEDLHIGSMETIDKEGSFFDKTFTNVEKLLFEDHKRSQNDMVGTAIPLVPVYIVSFIIFLIMVTLRGIAGWESNFIYILVTEILTLILYPVSIVLLISRFVKFERYL